MAIDLPERVYERQSTSLEETLEHETLLRRHQDPSQSTERDKDDEAYPSDLLGNQGTAVTDHSPPQGPDSPVSLSDQVLSSIPLPTLQQRSQQNVASNLAVVIPARSITSTVQAEVASQGRRLRPRTYQQLHTYEYEHAKYVLECRAAGIKPVQFDGTRYREMDKADKDFVPPSEKVDRPRRRASASSGALSGSQEESTAIAVDLADLQNSSQLSRKRKRSKDPAKFRDPRQFARKLNSAGSQSPSNDATTDAQDMFDFPDQHWQADLSLLPSSSQPTPDSLISSGDITVIEDASHSSTPILIDSQASDVSSDSQAGHAAAKARFARKLKGVLPPSFLSRKNDSELNRRPIDKRVVVPAPRKLELPPPGKGIAKKKLTSAMKLSFDSPLKQKRWENAATNSPETIHLLHANDSFEGSYADRIQISDDEEDDIPETEEAIDRMLPTRNVTSKRPRSKNMPRNSRTRSRRDTPEIFLEDLVRVRGRDQVSKELRLACRTVRKRNSGGTQLERKDFDFHDKVVRQVRRMETMVRGSHEGTASTSGDSEDPEQNLVRWKQNKLSCPTRPRRRAPIVSSRIPGQHSSARRQTIRQVAPVKTSDQVRHQSLPIRTTSKPDSVINATTVPDTSQPAASSTGSDQERRRTSSIAHGFFLDSDEDEAMPDIRLSESMNRPIPLLASKPTPNAMPSAESLMARRFPTNLEHETGRYVNIQRSTRVRKKKPSYLHRFDQINNIFAAEPDHVTKVSQWQTNELPKATVNRVLIDADDSHSRLKERNHRLKKRPAKRNILKQKSILPFVSLNDETEGRLERTPFGLPNLIPDVSLGAEPAVVGIFFSWQTLLGSSGLSKILENDSESRVTSCYIANRQLFSTDAKGAADYGFTAVISLVRNLHLGQEIPEDELVSIYDFFRFLASMQHIDSSLMLAILDHLQRLLEDLGNVQENPGNGNRLSRMTLWITMYSVVVSHMFSRSRQEDPLVRIQVENSCLSRAVAMLLKIGFEPLRHLFRAQQDATIRSQGLKTSFADSLLETWIVVVNISQATNSKFWERINCSLDLDNIIDNQSAELAWGTLMQISSVTQFDILGKSRAVNIPNWPAVEKLLDVLFCNYVTENDRARSTVDAYILVLLRRVHRMIDIWHWPNCSVLLGHGRTGGVLHRFFFQDLRLGDLVSERLQENTFPRFLQHMDDSQCLTYLDVAVENAFGMFLKLVCLGIKQFLEELKLEPDNMERMKRRGIGVVDKFATHGRLSYLATESLDLRTVSEVRNRFALEIAVYWSADSWKDRGVSNMIAAAIAAMPGSHLALRKINIRAWEMVIKLQLRRAEHSRLEESVAWLVAVVQATVSDVLQFHHQARLNRADAKLVNGLEKNLAKCRQTLQHCFQTYLSVISHPSGSTTAARLEHLWSNDILKAVLQLHESFIDGTRSISLLEDAFKISLALVSNSTKFGTEQDSQNYDDVFFSQESSHSQKGDEVLTQKLQGLATLSFQYLTNLSAQEAVTATNKSLAKVGLQAFARIVIALRTRQQLSWIELFDERGTYSWTRLLDKPIKAIMLPYYLAVLIDADRTFYEDMYETILSTWFSCAAHIQIKDSLSALTSILIKKQSRHIRVHPLLRQSNQHLMTSSFLSLHRAEIVIQALQSFSETEQSQPGHSTAPALARSSLCALILSLRSAYEAILPEDSATRAAYIIFIQQILAAIHQYCTATLRLLTTDDRRNLEWLSNHDNVPQVRTGFAAETFRAYAQQDLAKKGLEVCLNLLGRCDVHILDEDNNFANFLIAALSNNPLFLESAPPWDEAIANLRQFVYADVLCALADLLSTYPSALLYLTMLTKSGALLYEALLDQSWAGDKDYILPIITECLSMYVKLHAHELTLSLAKVHRRIISNLIKFSWVDTTTRSTIQQSLHNPNAHSAQSVADITITRAISNHLQSTWTETPNGFYHVRRRMTIPFPSAFSTRASESSTALASSVPAIGDVPYRASGDSLSELHL